MDCLLCAAHSVIAETPPLDQRLGNSKSDSDPGFAIRATRRFVIRAANDPASPAFRRARRAVVPALLRLPPYQMSEPRSASPGSLDRARWLGGRIDDGRGVPHARVPWRPDSAAPPPPPWTLTGRPGWQSVISCRPARQGGPSAEHRQDSARESRRAGCRPSAADPTLCRRPGSQSRSRRSQRRGGVPPSGLGSNGRRAAAGSRRPTSRLIWGTGRFVG